MEVLTSSFLNDMKPTSDNRSSIMTMALVVTSQFDAMSESEEVHERTLKLRDEFELLVDASLKRNMLRRKHLFYLTINALVFVNYLYP